MPTQIRLVLIAGDTVENRALWGSYFDNWKIRYAEMETFTELRKRLNSLAAEGAKPDAVLLLEPLQDAKIDQDVAALQHEGIRVVCCLAEPNRELKNKLEQLGANVVQKPMKQSSLLDALMSTFTVLPTSSASHLERTLPVDALEKHHILLAEDNPVNQRVAVHMLSRLGISVDVVNNGAEAVAAAQDGDYVLALMDCQMPEMDGYQATAAIRLAEQNTTRHLPIIAMTANAMEGDRDKCLAAGMDDYISKPIEIKRLQTVLTTWLESAPAPASRPKTVPEVAAVIDISRLTDMIGDDPELLRDLLVLFKDSLLRLNQQLKHAVLNRAANVKSLAHEYKGSAANVGAAALAALGEMIESEADSHNWDRLGQLVDEAEKESVRAIAFIDRFGQK